MERTYTFEDLMAALRRRRWRALGVFAVVLAGGLGVAMLLPAEYTASSTVQIEPRRLTADFLPAQGIVPLEDRMRTVKHGILARPVLEQVIRETDFFPDMKDDIDGAVEKLRRQVEVRLEGEVPGGPPALLFVVSVRGRDAAKVKAAAELLPRHYEEMTRRVLATQARTLRKTLDDQTAQISPELAAGERKILEFKQAHLDALPEAADANARASGRAQALLELEQGALLEAQRRRAALLGAIPEGVSSAGMAEAAVDTAQRKLEAAQAAYGPDTPDVRRAQRELADAKAHRDEELDRYQKMRVDDGLARIDAEVKEHRTQVASLRRDIDSYARRAEEAPRWGQELAALTRDYDALRAKYLSTVSRQADASSAEELLKADGPGLFRVVEPAVVPEHTSAPDRNRLSILAVLAAIAVAIGAVAISEWADASMRGPEDAASHGVPVLAAIPRIGRR